MRRFGILRQGWLRSVRTGAVSRCAGAVGVAAVLVNVFAWLLVATPAASAQAEISSFSVEICAHGSPAQGGSSDHPLCPLCFPLGGHCSAAFLPISPELPVIASPLGLVEAANPTRLTAAFRLFRRHARAPPTPA
jgi:hypothetical protein